MNLSESHIRKSDPILLARLADAKEEEVLRVAMMLTADSLSQNMNLPTLEPSQFSSRVAYRQALIQRQQTFLEATIGSTIQDLQNLSIKTYGGTTSRVIIAEGTAKQILKSLELSGVYHASFDQAIELKPISPSNETLKSAKYLTQIAIEIFGIEEDESVPDQSLIHRSFERYIENYKSRHCRVKVLGMREPIELESIYTDVRLLDNTSIFHSIFLQDMENSYREQRQRHQHNSIRLQSGMELASQEQFLMVLGAPGAGKSTFLRRIGVELINGHSEIFGHPCIPTLIEIKQFNKSGIDLLEFIVNDFQSCDFPLAQQFVRRSLHQGKLLILLDGLDELPTQDSDKVVTGIQRFVEQYPKNRYVVSCRNAAYQNQFYGFTNVIIGNFNDKQIKRFIDNWFNQDKDKNAGVAEKCWEILKSHDYQATKELAHTPLLLTFLCLVYDDCQSFPSNRSELYKDALDILLRRWAAEKRISNDAIFKNFSANREEVLLSEIAAMGFEANRIFFSQDELIQKIQAFLVDNLNTSKQLNVKSILNAIVVQQGILIEKTENTYCFSHLTLQEYLTAQYICDHNKTEQLVVRHLTDPRWREVFLLVAGLIRGGADGLLLSMERQAQSYISPDEIKQWHSLTDRFNTLDGSKLHNLLKWADKVTKDSESSYEPVAKERLLLLLHLPLVSFL